VHLGTQSTGRVVLSGTLPLTFSAGQLFPFAVDTAAAAVSLPAGVCPEGYHSEASWQVGGTPTPVGTAGGIVGAGALDNAARGDPPHIGRGRTGGLLRRSEGAQQWG